MPILKNQDAAGVMNQAIVLEMGDLRRQAVGIIVKAKDQAKAILDAAAEQNQTIVARARKEALEQGRAEGFAQGRSEGSQRGHDEALQQERPQLDQLQAAWTEAAEAWQKRRDQIERELRRGAIEFAQRLAAKLVHRVVEVDEQVIVDQVAAAMSHLTRPLDVSVRIHGDDRPVLERAMPQLTAKMSNLKSLRLIDDPTVARGGCLLSNDQGQIDATLDTQLRRIAELMAPERTVPPPTPASKPEQASP